MAHRLVIMTKMHWIQRSLVVSIFVAYLLLFFPLYSARGTAILPMSVIPVIAAGLVYGFRAGLLAGLLIFFINTWLMNMVGESGWDVVFQRGGGAGSVAAILVGAIIGRFRDMSKKLRQELTERMKAEAALQASEERFRMLTEGSLAGVYILQGSNFLYVNGALAATFGYQPTDMIGRMCALDVVHPESLDVVQEVLQTILDGDVEGARVTFTGLHKNGTPILCEGLGRSVDLQGQQVLMGTLLDITEHIRAQDELLKAERLQAELEKEKELSELKARFVSMMSHEFRNPLAIISTTTQMLQKYNDRLSKEQRQAKLVQIQESASRLTDLLDDTLTLSKAEKVGLDIHAATIDLVQFCRDEVNRALVLGGALHDIYLSVTGTCTQVRADPNLLHQMIANLLSNAIKYSPDGGQIRVKLRCQLSETVIIVQDKGIGISEEDQKRLFDDYHRGTNVGIIPGTGLGLAIVKRAVEAHGGTVSVKSSEGKGTTFTVVLPVCQEGLNSEQAVTLA